MTTRVKIVHDGGNHPVEVFDKNGDVVAVLEKQGDEFGDTVYGDKLFTVAEKKD